MPRDWRRYLANKHTDPGRALIELGTRIDEARQLLSDEVYLRVLADAEITARDARALMAIGRRLKPILEHRPKLRLPIRIRTLASLAELSADALTYAADRGLIRATMTEYDARSLGRTQSRRYSEVIRPTDNWSFSTLQWPRIDGLDRHGYLPGDIYVNCLWYYTQDEDIVVDPMAGSGMLFRVWEDRATWMGDNPWTLKIILSDLCPCGPYVDNILACDLLKEFPCDSADYIILDPPYCGLVSGQYSELPNDLANMDAERWIESMTLIANRFRAVQGRGGKCTIIVPNYRVITTRERILFPEIVRQIFFKSGYQFYDVTYASRRTQQKQSRRMGALNNHSRRNRVPLADIAEVLTFIAS